MEGDEREGENFTARIISGGRITIPEGLRRKHNLKVGAFVKIQIIGRIDV